VDLAGSFAKEIEQLQFSNPGHVVELDVEGDVQGDWDERRLQQVLGNLVLNAIKYGDRKESIRVRLIGAEDSVTFEVINSGAIVAPDGIDQLFEPLRRGQRNEKLQHSDNLGLGLFIAREIAIAHGGQINVHPHPKTTSFSVRLPRSRRSPTPA
jgi:hypothetical protein